MNLKLLALACIAAVSVFVISSAAAPASAAPILDKQKQLDRFHFWDNKDWGWYKANIPFFESPDPAIDETYYYRWELLTKHLTYGSPESGYSFSEFVNRPGWSGAYGAISCPLGHQLYEARWLRDRSIPEDFARYWFGTPGAQPRSYSNWYGDAVWASYLVTGDKPFMVGLLPSMEAQYSGWLAEHWDPEKQMFFWSGMHDGMEFNIESRQTSDEFAGADNFRPTLNSYVFADLMAMAKTARLAGDPAKAAQYQAKADALKARVQSQLWDPKRQFFSSMFAHDETKDGATIKAGTLVYDDGKYKGDPHGRQLTGFVPWEFNLPDKNKGYEVAWKMVADPNVFLAPYGLYFTEKNDPQFKVAQTSCVWSGNNWAFADSQTLTAMANVLNNYPQNVVTKADYFKVLHSYTVCQRKDGKPYDAETSDPDTGRWTQDVPNSSDHYFHSSYVDLVITGLAGLRPRADNIVEINPLAPDTWAYFALDDVAYHGHNLSIVWDRTGRKYGRGKGLTLWADGKKLASSLALGRLTAALPTTARAAGYSKRPTVNFAVNNSGTYFPRVRASYTAPGTSLGNISDGTYFYHAVRPVNRWTTEGAASGPQWIMVDFGIARPVEQVKLYLLGDGPNSPVRAPKSLALDYWDGTAWKPVPGQKMPAVVEGHRPTMIAFPALPVSRLRVTLTPQPGAAVGMTELEAWGKATLPLPVPPTPAGNLALGAKASASYTSPYDKVEEINDGIAAMEGGRNRWTAYQSPNPTDWVQLDFGKVVTVGRMDFSLWTDGGGVRVPKSFTVQYWDSAAWQPVTETGRDPTDPTALVPNEVTIKPVQTQKLRVTFTHNLPGYSGVTEWSVWPQ